MVGFKDLKKEMGCFHNLFLLHQIFAKVKLIKKMKLIQTLKLKMKKIHFQKELVQMENL
jgi:hypothetical protein